MKDFYSEGLLPREYINESFKRLLTIKSGTIGEAFERIAEEMSVEYREQYYDYLFELEGYVNEIIRQSPSKDFTLMHAIPPAVKNYLLDVFHDNIYTYADIIMEQCLEEQGLTKKQIEDLNVRWIISYVDENTSIRRLRKIAKKQIPIAD